MLLCVRHDSVVIHIQDLFFNESTLLTGNDFKITDNITVHQPTLEEIFDYGEDKYWNLAGLLTATPSDLKSELFDKFNLEFDKVDEFYVFCLIALGIPKEISKIFLGNINFQSYHIDFKEPDFNIVLADKKKNIIFDEIIHAIFSEYLRKMHGFTKNIEIAGSDETRKFMIDWARDEIEESKNKKFKSILLPLIQFAVNSAGFKYDHKSVLKLPIYVFMHSYRQILHEKYVDNLFGGVYAGTVEYKKVKKDLNYILECS